MNKFRLVGLAVALAVGMSFAQGSLWSYNGEYGIVYFDWIKACMDDDVNFNPNDKNDPCYKDHGGWWYGYVAGPDSGDDAPDCGPSSKKSKYPDGNYVRAKIDGNWVSFIGPDNEDILTEGPNSGKAACEGPAVTNMENGEPLLDGALELELHIGTGIEIPDDDVYEPAIAAFAVNLSWADERAGLSPETPRDFTDKNGFCITYTSDHTAATDLAIELGWDENGASSSNKVPYDTWIHTIPVASGIATANFPWSSFVQEGWAKPAPWPLSKATGEMRSVKFRLKGYEPEKVNFKLIQFGWLNECDGGIPARIASGSKVENALNFNMVGKTVHMTVSKPTTVQVINLQGKVVRTQTLTSVNGKMNLNNLPTGVYMVRAPSIGYTNKIIIK